MREPALLCVCNYPANTGYAWDFIESLYAELARRVAARGIRTFVAYPKIGQPPRTLKDSPAQAVELDAVLSTRESTKVAQAFIKRENVRVLYLTDRPAWSLAYAAVRRAGVRSVIVHDHTSGARSVPRGSRWAVKAVVARLPWIVADTVIAVSDYVATRQVETGLIPRERVERVWNGIPVPPLGAADGRPLHLALNLSQNRPLIACACRAATEKGVPVLLRAFDRLLRQDNARTPRPVLVYMGDGPAFLGIQRTRDELESKDDILLTGYQPDAGALIAGADICVMPSLWQDALPLAVMQPMALGRPVVASAVGGIPEMIVDGVTGLLVPPNDDVALAVALGRLIDDPVLASRFGLAGRARVAEMFTPARQNDALSAIVLRGFESGRPTAKPA